MTRCPETTKKGAPCRWLAEFSDGRCEWHSTDPAAVQARAEKQRAAQASGAKTRAERAEKARTLLALDVKLDTETDIKRVLEQTTQQVIAGSMRPDAAQAIARLCSAALGIVDGKNKRALDELKKQIEEQAGRGRKGLRAV